MHSRKEKNGGGKLAGPSMPRTSNLDDAMKTLKYKYVELQDSHSKELQVKQTSAVAP
jgi:hypothetical protein